MRGLLAELLSNLRGNLGLFEPLMPLPKLHRLAPVLFVGVPTAALLAQAPPGWLQSAPLGAGVDKGAWWGAGLWTADGSEGGMPLIAGLGFGSSLQGGGISLSAGYRGTRWDIAGEGLAWRDPAGRRRTSLDRFHVWRRSQAGWLVGLEREPLVWGYGLNGGYLLGTASQPIPKVRLQSPFRDIRILGVPLGTWRGEVFLGQMNNRQPVSPLVQDYSYRIRAVAAYNPQRPFLSGIRAEARFGDLMEFYLNWINLFGGTINGKSLTEGYSVSEWATAFFGLKDTLAEGNIDFSDPNHPEGVYKNRARSASNSDVGARVRIPALEQLFHAEDVRIYASKGSKGVNTYFGTFFHRPFYYLGKDLNQDWSNLVHARFNRTYDQRLRYSAPSADVPNNSIGILITWHQVKLGLESLDTVNPFEQDGRPLEGGHRSFEHGSYRSGFYESGDPLGNAFGGETRSYTAYVEMEREAMSIRSWFYFGVRPFRDELALWQVDHPGAEVSPNRFAGVQSELVWKRPGGQAWSLGAELQRQRAYRNVRGDDRTDARGYLAWSWRSGH